MNTVLLCWRGVSESYVIYPKWLHIPYIEHYFWKESPGQVKHYIGNRVPFWVEQFSAPPIAPNRENSGIRDKGPGLK